MGWQRLGAACVIVAIAVGCGPGPPPPETKDAAAYARSIKQLVDEFVEEGNRNPATAPKQAAVLLETLEVYKTKPVGDHEAIYAELTNRCRELSTASATEVRKKLSDMAALAQKLPAGPKY